MAKVLHLSSTPLNGHPSFIAEMQRRQGWDAKVCLRSDRLGSNRPYPCDMSVQEKRVFTEYARTVDILHLHGDMTPSDPVAIALIPTLKHGAIVVHQMYHEVARIQPANLRHSSNHISQVYLARKGAIIDKQKNTLPIVVPSWRPDMQSNVNWGLSKRTLVWTPTSRDKMLSYKGTKGKGYHETMKALKSIANLVDIKIIENMSWARTMDICSQAHYRLDELMTGNYGLSTLEGFVHGSIVIGGMSEDVRTRFLPNLPYYPTTSVASIADIIREHLRNSGTESAALTKDNKDWFNQYHSEAACFKAYSDFYDAVRIANNETAHTGGIVTLGKPQPIKKAPPKATNPEQPIVKKPERGVHRRVNRRVIKKTTTEKPLPPTKKKKKGSISILQISTTHCAGAIWKIHDAINNHTEHVCRTITASDRTNNRKFPTDILLTERRKVAQAIQEADVIHFHNWIDYRHRQMQPYAKQLAGKKMIIQYHTEPNILRRAYPGIDVINRSDITTITIAQKHARFYPKSGIVPNIVDIHHKSLTPSGRRYISGPLKVIFTPSDIRRYSDYRNTCCGKGYEECMPVLKRLQAEGIIDLQVITDMTWEKLMPIKRQCDVCLDEVMTGGYHLCSLESLSQGLITIANIDSQTDEVIRKVTGCTGELPWVNTTLRTLESTLRELAAKTPDEIADLKHEARTWMVQNWETTQMISHYVDLYTHVLNPKEIMAPIFNSENPPEVWIYSDGSNDENIDALVKSITTHTGDFSLHILCCPNLAPNTLQKYQLRDWHTYSSRKDGKRFSEQEGRTAKASYLCWVIPSLSKSGRAIYLDSDVIVTGNLNEAWLSKNLDGLISVAPDPQNALIHDHWGVNCVYPNDGTPNVDSLLYMIINSQTWKGDRDTREMVNAYTDIPVGKQTPLRDEYKKPSRMTEDLYDLPQGRSNDTVVIWGNGPSLKAYNASSFGDVDHYGVNGGGRLDVPYTAFFVSDNRFIATQENRDLLKVTSGIKVCLAHVGAELDKLEPAHNWDKWNRVPTCGASGIRNHPVSGFYHGYSVVWVALQCALYAGYSRIIVTGSEYVYTKESPRFYEEALESGTDLKMSLRHIQKLWQTIKGLQADLGIEIIDASGERGLLHTCGFAPFQTPS